MPWYGEGDPDVSSASGDDGTFSYNFFFSEDDIWGQVNDWGATFDQHEDDFLFGHGEGDYAVPHGVFPDTSNVHIVPDWDQSPIQAAEKQTSFKSVSSICVIIFVVTIVFCLCYHTFRTLKSHNNDNAENIDHDRSDRSSRDPPLDSDAATGEAVPIYDEVNTNASAASRRVGKVDAEIPLEKRMMLYSEAFNRNQNQTILEESAIVLGTHNAGNGNDDGKGNGSNHSSRSRSRNSNRSGSNDDDEDSYCSILRALENTQALRRSVPRGSTITIERKSCSSVTTTKSTNSSRIDMTGDRKKHTEKSDETMVTDIIESDTDSVTDSDSGSDGVVSRSNTPRETSNILHPRCSGTFSGGDVEEGRMVVPRTCVICFEEMKPGEMIVWSETGSCPHVYHKDCIVSFFAHKKQTPEQLGLDHNPCPTCRQPFVTLCGRAS